MEPMLVKSQRTSFHRKDFKGIFPRALEGSLWKWSILWGGGDSNFCPSLLTLGCNSNFNLLFWQGRGQHSRAFIWSSHSHNSYSIGKGPSVERYQIPNIFIPLRHLRARTMIPEQVSTPCKPTMNLILDKILFVTWPHIPYTNRGTVMTLHVSRYQYLLRFCF